MLHNSSICKLQNLDRNDFYYTLCFILPRLLAVFVAVILNVAVLVIRGQIFNLKKKKKKKKDGHTRNGLTL